MAAPSFQSGVVNIWGVQEPLRKSRTAGFPVRPANTTIDQPVNEFFGSATDLQKRIIIISVGFAVQDVKWLLCFIVTSRLSVSRPVLDTAVKGFLNGEAVTCEVVCRPVGG